MTPEELEAHRRDPQNWKWGVYYCKADPRVIVPKRFKCLGWTINFARPSAIPVVVLTLMILVLPVLFVRTGAVLACFAIIGAVLCFLCACLSSSSRWNR